MENLQKLINERRQELSMIELSNHNDLLRRINRMQEELKVLRDKTAKVLRGGI